MACRLMTPLQKDLQCMVDYKAHDTKNLPNRKARCT